MTFSSSGHQIFIWIRERSFSWSMLKLMPLDSVARYSLTGIVTSPNWMAPFHIARATAHPHARLSPAGAGIGRYHSGQRRRPVRRRRPLQLSYQFSERSALAAGTNGGFSVVDPD